MGIVWENMTPSTELPRDFCAGIGPLQLGVVLVYYLFTRAESQLNRRISDGVNLQSFSRRNYDDFQKAFKKRFNHNFTGAKMPLKQLFSDSVILLSIFMVKFQRRLVEI